MVDIGEPPIQAKYIADAEGDNANDAMYYDATRTRGSKRGRNRQQGILPPCRDKLTEVQQAKFKEFGVIL